MILDTATAHMASDTSLDTRIERHTRDVLGNDELFVVGISIRGQKGSRLIEIFVDGDQGVGVKDLARISRELAFILEAEDIVKGKYHLNVSTPGAERAFLLERQYQRHVGKKLDLLVVDEDGHISVEGENLGVTDGVLRVRTSSNESMEIPLERISKAQIILPW